MSIFSRTDTQMQDPKAAGRPRSLFRWGAGIGGLLFFLVAVQLLKSATGEMTPTLERVLPRLVRDDLSALGTSWLAAYLLLNGSVVAALALTLYNASLLTTSQLVLMVFGSRLGAAGIVLLVGVLDFFHHRRLTVRKASELGVIAFLVTHTIGLPATAIGALWTHTRPLGWVPHEAGEMAGHLHMPHVIDWLAATVVAHAGPLLSVLAAMGLLLGGLRLLGRVFDEVDFEQIRERYRRYFSSRWVAFGVGLGLTALTTSIAFSLGVIVPIYNRGYLRHREVIPYMFGANIGTLLDTVVVSLFVEVAGGVEAVLLVAAVTALVTLPALVALKRYQMLIDVVLNRLLDSRRAFLLFLGSLGLGPLALVGVGWWLAG